MLSRGISVKRRYGGAGFALVCGCKDAKSVSVSPSVSASPSPSGAGTSTTTETPRPRRGGMTNPSASTMTSTDTLTLTSASSSSFVWEDAVAEFDELERESSGAAQSFSGLLRELSELEQTVASWGHRDKKLSSAQVLQDRVDEKPSTPPPREHRKQATMPTSGDLTTGYLAGDSFEVAGLELDDGRVEVGLDGSVAVVKQSEDPLGDFRRSMVQMIVENGIVAGEELREMLRRFLGLNAPCHHDAILRAFAEIWDAVFFTDDDDPAPATATTPPARKYYTRREPASPGRPRPPAPRTPPPRHRRSPSSAWRV